MTSISSSVAAAQTSAAPKASTRNAALDRARTFITMLVLIHHSVIAYTYYGHTDRALFLGFDGVVLFNDSFFMSAMFFLSGCSSGQACSAREPAGSCATAAGVSACPSWSVRCF